jgi:hypothetical protein
VADLGLKWEGLGGRMGMIMTSMVQSVVRLFLVDVWMDFCSCDDITKQAVYGISGSCSVPLEGLTLSFSYRMGSVQTAPNC